ncbi:MAG: carbohydrate ABC transporter permease [Zhenhengia sp.]|jgi:N-acetylglucosamine transport system permease protein|uniref:carbohydrate ABC transporter permease n=1 Tax=Zhenhengia sp. TaxID=2944208 RepID=UPI002910A254|nr:sugar ABC transporter permease [Clostridiales bacterium]MDU6973243.1 sugar ABC transporter permease [Clostridiales bacterium]
MTNLKKYMPKKQQTRRNIAITVSLLPALALYALFVIYPTFNVFRTSMYQWSGLSKQKTFIGFENFIRLFNDTKFWTALQNTIFLLIFCTAVTMILALFFAAALTQSKLKEKNFYRVLFFFPNVLSIVVIGVLFSNIYEPNMGILNSLLRGIGLNNLAQPWLGSGKTVLWAIGIAMIWQAVGYYMVMYMAGMDGISPELYEAADIDGASKFVQFFKITIPMIWGILRVTLVFFITSTLNMSFLFVNVMTDGAPNGSSEVLLTYMYRQAFTNANFGYAMAIAVIIFIVAFSLAIISNILTKKNDA